ncbi:hypothetical protein CEXT_708351 [Caerostris extrusa]|uniref:Uncharacterized protein n=1 Tax=Caerostris extrusa TaxID=172846 RepID=A0AAV4SYI7_CAEEX|nr:hypothetical protein CEXT_708351 [Caerostris extrusa]
MPSIPLSRVSIPEGNSVSKEEYQNSQEHLCCPLTVAVDTRPQPLPPQIPLVQNLDQTETDSSQNDAGHQLHRDARNPEEHVLEQIVVHLGYAIEMYKVDDPPSLLTAGMMVEDRYTGMPKRGKLSMSPRWHTLPEPCCTRLCCCVGIPQSEIAR